MAKVLFKLEDGREVFEFGAGERKSIDEEKGIYEAMITTANPDRDGDIVMPSGMRNEAFLKNPVVAFAHQYREPPVAKTLALVTTEAGIMARFQFPPLGDSPRADEIHKLWRAGFLNATSIGFIPLKWEALPTERETFFPPRKYVEWELLEFSIVVVPANRDAVRLALTTLEEEASELEQDRDLEQVVAQKILVYVQALKEVVCR